MNGQPYPAARALASQARAHFDRHLEEARGRGLNDLGALPGEDAIEAVITAAFWASLRREEGYMPKISLAFLSPEQARHPLTFERPLALAPETLARVAPAVDRPGIHLAVWPSAHGLCVWGTALSIPPLCFVLEVSAPGLLVIKHHRGGDAAKFANIAVLEGDRIKIVDERASNLPDCPALITSMLGLDSPVSWSDSVNVLVQLAVSMRAHGRGGSLLVVPAGTEAWRESILQPIPYAVSPPFAELATLLSEAPARPLRRDALTRTVDAVAGLTAVDGAAVMNSRYELLGFGAKIARRRGAPRVEQVIATEPIENGEAALVHPEQLGGTRHFSAAQFAQDQRDALALVASQDGRFTVFAWSPCETTVHAHRVDVLLL